MQTQILVDGSWVNGVPTVDGQEYRKVIKVGLSTGYERLTYITPAIEKPLTPIVITSVTGALLTSSDFTYVRCNELTDIVISGTLDVPDNAFAMPIKRSDGKVILFGVDVIDGKFDAVLNFPTSGMYQYTDIEANTDLPEPMFKVEPIKIDVLRKTGA